MKTGQRVQIQVSAVQVLLFLLLVNEFVVFLRLEENKRILLAKQSESAIDIE